MGKKEKEQVQKPISLRKLVSLGVTSSVLVVGGLFLLFAAYESRTWLFWTAEEHLDPDTLFGVGRNAVTLAAALGVGVTLFFSYRKQQTAEKAQELAAASQVTATKAQELATRTLQLSLDKHDLENVSELRNRYAKSAEQLGSDKTAVRMAGVHSLAALSDDWLALGKKDEQQVCISLLCSYMNALRTERTAADDLVKKTALETITARLTAEQDSQVAHWGDRRVEVVGAFFQSGLRGFAVNGGAIEFQDCHLPSSTWFHGFNMSEGSLAMGGTNSPGTRIPNFAQSNFNGGSVNLRIGHPDQGVMWMRGCDFNGSDVSITGIARQIRFEGCTFSDGGVFVSLIGADHEVTFNQCTFLNSEVVKIAQHEGHTTKTNFTKCVFDADLGQMSSNPEESILLPHRPMRSKLRSPNGGTR